MKKIDITNILLNENAYFYKAKKRVSKANVLTLFREARDDKEAKRSYDSIIRQSLFESGQEIAKYSLDIFDFDQKPSFLKEEQDLWETKTAFLLLLEYRDYLVVFRKNISGVKTLKAIAEPIDYNVLANFYINDKSRFEKIISSSLNTADNAIQTKTSEAIDLQGVMTRFGASKQVISALRLDNNGEKATVSLSTSRVNALKLRQDFENVLFWAIKMCNLITAAITNNKTHRFIASFAEPIDFEKEIKSLIPKYLMFRFSPLFEQLESGLIQRVYRLVENEKQEEINIIEEISPFISLITLSKKNEVRYTGSDVTVHINKKTMTIHCESFKDIYIVVQDNSIRLSEYLNTRNDYLITFEQPEYAYTHHKIFKDHRLLNDLDVFLETFIPEPLLQNVTSEKGIGYTTTSTTFSPNSIFGVMDTALANKQCVICDDMGVEWGDFISIHNNEIAFYHCKYNDNALSASDLQEVFGQAQKNLGYLELNDEMVEYRRHRWSSKYRLNGIQTRIKRIRRCANPARPLASVKESIYKASASGNLKRSVFAVINFLSKTELTASLNRLKKGETFENKGITLQILWFVNAVLSSANEIGVEFRVICRP